MLNRNLWSLLALAAALACPLSLRSQQSTPPSSQPSSPSSTASGPARTSSQASASPEASSDLIAVDRNLGTPAAAWALLTSGVESPKVRNRSDALSALTILDTDRKAISLIQNALTDKEEDVRFLSADSLGNIKARPAIPALKTALDDPSARVSFAAAQSLWKMGDYSGRYVLYAIMDGERKAGPGIIQGKVKDAKRTMHDPKAMALLGVNEVSGIFLGPFSMGLSMAEEYAKNNSAPVQALCAQLLSSDDGQLTREELRDALGDKNWAVRAAAAKSLAKLHDTKSLPVLKDMMQNDKVESARFVAAAALIRFDQNGGKTASGHRDTTEATAKRHGASKQSENTPH